MNMNQTTILTYGWKSGRYWKAKKYKNKWLRETGQGDKASANTIFLKEKKKKGRGKNSHNVK